MKARKTNWLGPLLWCVFGCACFAQATAPQEPASNKAPAVVPVVVAAAAGAPVGTPAAAADDSYRLGPGDVIDINVSKHPDYSRSDVRVDNDGKIQIPRDDVQLTAACRTVREVAEAIKERYQKYLRTPYVYVSVKEFNSQPVAVIGAVTTPGQFKLQRRIRLLELLTFVNGPSDKAGRSVHIVRAGQAAACEAPPPGQEPADLSESFVAYNLDDTLRADEKANPYIRPGDIVRLPEADQVFVVGNVKNAAPIALKDSVTLSEVIAMSGGLTPEANGDKVRIIRRSPGGTGKTELVASLKAISKRQAEDVVLQADDIIEVPGPSGGRKFLDGLKKTLLPSIARFPLGIIP